MSRIVITKRLEIDAGHRLMKHEGKCRHMHGHRYAFEIEASANDLDEVGRIVDFSVIKTRVGGWLDEQLDHGFIVQAGDNAVINFLMADGSKHYIVGFPPTAENLSRHVLQSAQLLLSDCGVVVEAVTCFETPISWARCVRG